MSELGSEGIKVRLNETEPPASILFNGVEMSPTRVVAANGAKFYVYGSSTSIYPLEINTEGDRQIVSIGGEARVSFATHRIGTKGFECDQFVMGANKLPMIFYYEHGLSDVFGREGHDTEGDIATFSFTSYDGNIVLIPVLDGDQVAGLITTRIKPLYKKSEMETLERLKRATVPLHRDILRFLGLRSQLEKGYRRSILEIHREIYRSELKPPALLIVGETELVPIVQHIDGGGEVVVYGLAKNNTVKIDQNESRIQILVNNKEKLSFLFSDLGDGRIGFENINMPKTGSVPVVVYCDDGRYVAFNRSVIEESERKSKIESFPFAFFGKLVVIPIYNNRKVTAFILAGITSLYKESYLGEIVSIYEEIPPPPITLPKTLRFGKPPGKSSIQ